MKKFFCITILLILTLPNTSINARFFTPQTTIDFDRVLAGNTLAIVHFNPYAQGDVPEEDQIILNDMKQDFFELSQEPRYQRANVAFIGINTARLPELAKRYDVDPEEKATIVLYKDGSNYKEAKRKTGYMTKGQIRSFIEKFFGDKIDALWPSRPPARIVTRTYAQPVYEYSGSYPVDCYGCDYDYYVYPRYRYYAPYYNDGYPYFDWGYNQPGLGFNVGVASDGIGYGVGFGF